MMIECEMHVLLHIRRVLLVLCGSSMCDGHSASCLRHGINPHMHLPKLHPLQTIDIMIKIPSDMLSIHHNSSMCDVCSASCASIHACTALHHIPVCCLHTI